MQTSYSYIADNFGNNSTPLSQLWPWQLKPWIWLPQVYITLSFLPIVIHLEITFFPQFILNIMIFMLENCERKRTEILFFLDFYDQMSLGIFEFIKGKNPKRSKRNINLPIPTLIFSLNLIWKDIFRNYQVKQVFNHYWGLCFHLAHLNWCKPWHEAFNVLLMRSFSLNIDEKGFSSWLSNLKQTLVFLDSLLVTSPHFLSHLFLRKILEFYLGLLWYCFSLDFHLFLTLTLMKHSNFFSYCCFLL